jgi:hypothetical protein
MAVGSDLALPQVQGPRPLTVRLINAYIHRLLVAAEHDPTVAMRFLGVSAFLDKPPRHDTTDGRPGHLSQSTSPPARINDAAADNIRCALN